MATLAAHSDSPVTRHRLIPIIVIPVDGKAYELSIDACMQSISTNETETKQFQNCFVSVSFQLCRQFHAQVLWAPERSFNS